MKKIILTVFVSLLAVLSFAQNKNIVWQGTGLSTGNTNGTDFNTPANWVGNAVPGLTDTATMNLDKNGTVTFSATTTTIGALIVTLSKTKNIFILDIGGNSFTVNGTTNAAVMIGGSLDTLRFNVGNLGIFTLGGNATFGGVASGSNACFFAYGTGGTTGSVVYKGDLTLNAEALTSSINLPAKIVFDGGGNQLITDNAGNNILPVLQIGDKNKPTVTYKSSANNGIHPNDISINGTFVLPVSTNNYAISRTTGSGSLRISAGGSLKLEGSTDGLTGSNFPTNYSTVTLDSTSTVEFNGTAQTIPLPTAATVYGNLTLSGSGIKTVGNNISINRALDIGTGVTMALGANNATLVSNAQTTAFVKPVNGSITYGSGRFIIERFLRAITSWRLLATPIDIASSPTISASWRENEAIGTNTVAGKGTRITGPTGLDEYTQRASMKYYNSASNAYVDINAAALSSKIARDEGYYVFVRGDRTVPVGGANKVTNLRIAGQLRTGTQTFSVNKSSFQSIGNPFASPLNMLSVAFNTINRSFYVWDPIGGAPYGVGRFILYNYNGTNFETVPATTVRNFIQSGEAFFVQNNDLSMSGSLVIKEGDKANGSQLVSRNGEVGRPGVNLPTLEINLSSKDLYGTDIVADGAVLNFDEKYNNSVDNDDVRKISNTYDNIGIKQGGAILAVERRKTLTAKDTLRLNIGGMRVAAYKLQIDPSVLGNLALSAFLVDKFLATETPLSLITVTTVPFSIMSDAASWVADRFMIVFRQAASAPLPFGFTAVAANKNVDRTNTLKWTGANEINMGTYSIERSATPNGFVAIGTTVAKGINGNNASYTFIDAAPIAGINYYRIKATSKDAQVFYSDVVKVVNNDGRPMFAVQPNPVVDKTMNIHFDNLQGSYTMKLVSKQGAILFTKQVTVVNESEVKNFSVANVAAGVYELLLVDVKGKQLTQTIFIQ